MQCVEIIANAVKSSDLQPKIGDNEKCALNEVQEFLGVNKIQALLFTAVFMVSFKERRVYIGDIAEYLGASNFKVAARISDLEYLAKKKLILFYKQGFSPIADRDNTIHDISFCFSRKVLDAIMLEDKAGLYREEKVDMITLLELIYELVEERSDEKITYREMLQEVDDLLQINQKLKFVQNLKPLGVEPHERIFLLYVCREILKGEEDVDLIPALEKIYSDARVRFQMRRSLVVGHNILIYKDILKLSDGMFRSDRDICLTENGMEALFDKELKFLRNKEGRDKSLVLHEDIKASSMFYESNIQSQLDELTNILSEDNYQRSLTRLRAKGMPEGMAILLHGPPGTGKTATTYQIARQTGRDIMQVDISDTKSMWFGESEKRIKKVFDDYRNKLESGNKAPILLFNECDAVFGTRKKIGSSPVDQTENTIQNIILQSMEDLKGILIATTNLTHNLDKAFQRRFLWKILFDSPGAGAREQIWLSKLPFLKKKGAKELATQFSFSGGIIENIARKVMMYEIIQGELPDLSQVINYCLEEGSLSDKKNIIGF